MSTERETPRLRASDEERERVAGIVQTATGQGRLTAAEADERLAAVYAVKYTDELGPLVADLPDGERDSAPWGGLWGTDVGARWGGPGRGVRPQPESWRSMLRSPLGVHAAVVVALATIMTVRWFFMGIPFFWPAFPITWLAVSVLVHYGIRRFRQLRVAEHSWRARQEAPASQPRP